MWIEQHEFQRGAARLAEWRQVAPASRQAEIRALQAELDTMQALELLIQGEENGPAARQLARRASSEFADLRESKPQRTRYASERIAASIADDDMQGVTDALLDSAVELPLDEFATKLVLDLPRHFDVVLEPERVLHLVEAIHAEIDVRGQLSSKRVARRLLPESDVAD